VRALKILVVVMGVMLVTGFAVLVVLVAGRFSHPRALPVAAEAPLELPPGARIESIGVGADRLALAVILPNGDRQIVVIDLATGRRLGTIPLHTAR
jgi:hypothetical protein